MINISATGLGILIFISTISNVGANDALLWSSKLNKNGSFKNYSLINESEEGITKKLNEIIGSRAGQDMLDSTYIVTNWDDKKNTVTVESTLKSPDLQGNKISTRFSTKNYTMRKSTILKTYLNGSYDRNVIRIMPILDNTGKSVRKLTEKSTQIITQLLDNSAPLMDIISILYLMAGVNDSHVKIIHNKPIYFYLNGTIRKAKIQSSGVDSINWFGKKKKSNRFDMLREKQVIGSIWIDPKSGDPLKVKIGGMLNFSVKPD